MCLTEVAAALQTRRFSRSWNGAFANEDSGLYPGTTGWTRILFGLAHEQISRVVSCWEGEGYPHLCARSWPLIAESQARVHSILSVELSSWELAGAGLSLSHQQACSDSRSRLWELQELSILIWLIPSRSSLGARQRQPCLCPAGSRGPASCCAAAQAATRTQARWVWLGTGSDATRSAESYRASLEGKKG